MYTFYESTKYETVITKNSGVILGYLSTLTNYIHLHNHCHEYYNQLKKFLK